jgi:hypothetical protein
MRLPQLLATFGLVLAGTVDSRADDTLRDLTVEQANVHQAGSPKPGSLRVSAWVDRQDLTYSRGEPVRIFVQSNEDAYLTIVNVGPSGRVTQLFPNAFQSNNRVVAGQQVEVPSSDSGARITVSGAVGAELIKVFASSEPMQVIPEAQLQGNGAFLVMRGVASDLVRNLEVTANAPAAPNRKLAISNLIIKTMNERRSEASDSSFVVVLGSPTSQPAAVSAPTPEPSLVGIIPQAPAPPAQPVATAQAQRPPTR